MTSNQLRDIVANLLPHWCVTINEQYMLNVQADDLEKYLGFIYIEELDSSEISTKRGIQETHFHDLYFCRLNELDSTAEQREQIRDELIMPAVISVIKTMTKHGVYEFTKDKNPRGFDANEVVVHLTFTTTGQIC